MDVAFFEHVFSLVVCGPPLIIIGGGVITAPRHDAHRINANINSDVMVLVDFEFSFIRIGAARATPSEIRFTYLSCEMGVLWWRMH